MASYMADNLYEPLEGEPTLGKRRSLPSCHMRGTSMAVLLVLFLCFFIILVCVGASIIIDRNKSSAPVDLCSNPVYCTGELLLAVQMGNIFKDCKTFVDMPMLHPPEKIMQMFLKERKKAEFNLTHFVENNFDPPGSEIIRVIPPDYRNEPPFLAQVLDASLRNFSVDVHRKWKALLRTYNYTKYCPTCVSSLALPHPFVVPGGRFREFYYWDSFWILQGLLASGMKDTARDLIENIGSLIDRFGLMPNGARLYFLDRSQPPVLTWMVSWYYNKTQNWTLVESMLPTLQNEYTFWQGNGHPVRVRGRSGKMRTLTRYYVDVDFPRPESYREDVNTAHQVRETRSKKEVYSELATGAETGWDYSTRWFDPRQLKYLPSIETTKIIPADLNAILLRNEQLLARFFKQSGDTATSAYFQQQAQQREEAMWDVLWNVVNCSFGDYNIKEKGHTTHWYISNFVPLVVPSIVARLNRDLDRTCVLNTFSRLHALLVGGIPTSFVDSGQQWDFPNAWPPAQWFAAEALSQLGETRLHRTLVERWVTTNYCGYRKYRMMFEKYNASSVGESGNGGEYIPQDGFGWTNGVVLYFLEKYGSWLSSPTSCPNMF